MSPMIIISFFAGAGVGVGGSFFVFKKHYEKVTDINININENNIKKIINLQIQAYPGTCFSINESEIPLIITDKRNDIGYFYWQSTQPNINYISSLKIIDLPQEALNNTYPIIINYEYWE